jgi:formylglycine-generating enzyme required for sulfatase activity
MNRRDFMRYAGIGGAGLSLSLEAGAANSLAGSAAPNMPGLQTVRYEAITVDQSGRKIGLAEHRAQVFTQDLGRGATLDMVSIPEKPLFLGKTPVTQTQWQAGARLPRVNRDLPLNPSHVTAGDHPVECVSWRDAHEFCARLSVHSGMNYGLQSEANWESACRAGTKTPFHCGATVTADLANYNADHTYARETQGSYRRSTTPVGQFMPNAYGLYDMHGNVWEWCADHWQEDFRVAPVNGNPRVTANHPDWRVLRGGSWADAPAKLRSASRSGYGADSLNRIIGFRVAMYS